MGSITNTGEEVLDYFLTQISDIYDKKGRLGLEDKKSSVIDETVAHFNGADVSREFLERVYDTAIKSTEGALGTRFSFSVRRAKEEVLEQLAVQG